jgi:hypothetical protein
MSFGRQTHEFHRDDPLMVEARRTQGRALPAKES